jgi:CheY-like chemotaxis protein
MSMIKSMQETLHSHQSNRPLALRKVDIMANSSSNSSSNSVSKEAPKKRILVIDDEPQVRQVIQYCLEDLAGWETVAVGSAQEALVLATTLPFDAIVLDLVMPGMDGLMFLTALRADVNAPDLLVILLTGNASVYQNRLVDLDVAGIIAKPFDPIQLPIQIAQLLNWMPIVH